MRRYLFIIGAVLIGRILYIALLYAYIFGVAGFPSTFWQTGTGYSPSRYKENQTLTHSTVLVFLAKAEIDSIKIY